jgi:hypothetical protein
VAAADELQTTVTEHMPHMLVLSGGYGIVHASDLIGWYERRFRPRDWPPGLLTEVIAAYANEYRLSRARVFAAGTTSYAGFLQKIPWKSLSEHACRRPQYLQPPTPSRLTIEAADLPRRGGSAMVKRRRSSVKPAQPHASLIHARYRDKALQLVFAEVP